MDYSQITFVAIWGFFVLLVALIFFRSYLRKKRTKVIQCSACNGMGHMMSLNSRSPKCVNCGGTGYID